MWVWFVAAALAEEPTVKEVHRSEVDVVTPHVAVLPEPTPAYARCLVRVVIGSDGAPQSATPKEGCAMPEKAVAAAMAGRWKPKEGQAAPLAFYVPVEGRPLVPEGQLKFAVIAARTPEDGLSAFPDQTCPVQIGFAADGRVDILRFRDGCPEPLRAALAPFLTGWEAVPYVVDGKPVPALAEMVYQVESDGPRIVQPTDMQVKRRVMPTYPPEAWAQYGRDVDCAMRVFVDEEGVPYDFVPVDCPGPFVASTEEAITKWRWYPYTVDGAAEKVQFVMKVSYRKG